MVPAVVLRFEAQPLAQPWAESIIFGIGIVSAAFLLSWAAEAAQVEISAGLAVAGVALLTVLPEYAVAISFAWKAGVDPQTPAFLSGLAQAPESLSLPTANLTGSNRLLSGLGWPLVILLFWWRHRREVRLSPALTPEIVVLGLAALYTLLIVIRGEIAIWDAVVLAVLFLIYLWLVSGTGEHEQEPLLGPPATLAGLSLGRRRITLAALFVVAGAVVGLAAEPFANGLVQTGTELNVSRYLLVQWIAPLASEAPEILVATIFTVRGNPVFGIAALISAATNQWTILVASLPVAFSLGLGSVTSLPLDRLARADVLLTIAQIAFAVVLVSKLRIGAVGTGALLGLFAAQLAFSGATARLYLAAAFLALTITMLIARKEHVRGVQDRSVGFVRMMRERAGR